MMLVYPSYYPDFRCIADRCRHSCCVGWEIDVDAATLALYRSLEGELGDRLRRSIADGHFVQDASGRCPFLNDSGLCDLITACGEGALCDICYEHPRFRHWYSDREEVGLGLCCEAAVDLLLQQTEPIALVSEGEECATAAETAFFEARKELFAIAQDRSAPLTARMERLLELGGVSLPPLDWRTVYLSLERLDEKWTEELQNLRLLAVVPPDFEREFEHLLWYFLYRHLRPDGIAEGVGLAVLSTRIVASLLATGEQTTKRLADLVRQYSSEIEYSDQNPTVLAEKITDFRC